jgi:ferrochelatase
MRGLLLLNLGSPDAPERGAVARYLRQFLTDPRVIDIPALPRQFLVRGIIAPLRSGKSARAYRGVWLPEGSPLIVHSRALAQGVQTELGDAWKVSLGMRYGNPSMESAVSELAAAGCAEIVVLPLYPQYSSATTGSSLEELGRCLGKLWNVPSVRVLPPFYEAPGFLEAFVEPLRTSLSRLPDADVLFSFHGLPERQVHKGYADCLTGECCRTTRPFCYKSQCHATARALASRLSLPEDRWHISFQSRLGRQPWLSPSTLETARQLARQGSGTLVVAAPSFVADCLETLEELGDRLRKEYLAAGGKRFELASCPNASASWTRTVAEWARRGLPEK